LTALGFVFTTLAAKIISHEDVSGLRWTGVILIVIGALLVGWSEKQKKDQTEATGAAALKSGAPG
jgi:drug/metabolite transporter (DMT)-like permease